LYNVASLYPLFKRKIIVEAVFYDKINTTVARYIPYCPFILEKEYVAL
jgi:hypothetical protein